MKGVDFERAKIRLTEQLFQAMQRVTEDESTKLMERIREVDQMQNITPQDKSYLLRFHLLDLVGEEFLDDILSKYRADFTALPDETGHTAQPAPPDVGAAVSTLSEPPETPKKD